MSAAQQALLMLSGAAAASWQDVYHYQNGVAGISEGSDATGYSGYTVRFVIAAGNLPVNGSKLRFTFKAGNSVGAVIGAAYIGVAASSGDVYDFATTPTQVLFSGSGGVTVGAGAEVTCDEVTLATTTADGIVVALYFSSSTNLRNYLGSVHAWTTMRYKAGNDTTTVNASGYTLTSFASLRRLEIYG